ncbi:MAG: hypothetical protein ABI556_14705 [Gemmatimonadales bacterium]
MNLPIAAFDTAIASGLLDQAGWRRAGKGVRVAHGVKGITDNTPLTLGFTAMPGQTQYGAMAYNPANDIARIDLRQTTLATSLETLTMWLIPSRDPGPPKGQLVLAWGNVSLSTDWSVR